jgi:hypothetical protein
VGEEPAQAHGDAYEGGQGGQQPEPGLPPRLPPGEGFLDIVFPDAGEGVEQKQGSVFIHRRFPSFLMAFTV